MNKNIPDVKDEKMRGARNHAKKVPMHFKRLKDFLDLESLKEIAESRIAKKIIRLIIAKSVETVIANISQVNVQMPIDYMETET